MIAAQGEWRIDTSHHDYNNGHDLYNPFLTFMHSKCLYIHYYPDRLKIIAVQPRSIGKMTTTLTTITTITLPP